MRYQEVVATIFCCFLWTPRAQSVDVACPFLGQIYPPPTAISTSTIWQQAASNLSSAIAGLPSVKRNTTSFAIQIVSLDGPAPLFEYYNKAPEHLTGANGSGMVQGDTVFRVGSVSKIFAIHAILLKCGFACFNEPVAKYVPELAGESHNGRVADVNWNDVTVGMLASHLGGIGRDYALGDLATTPGIDPGYPFGFPNIAGLYQDQVPNCGVNALQPPCSRPIALQLLLQQPPIFSPAYTPAYSNAAFELAAFVLKNLTAQSYAESVTDTVFAPLNMTRTSVKTPSNSSEAVRIPGDLGYLWDLSGAFGGVYSSTSDLSRHALSILNYTQLTKVDTHLWLKPVTHTASLTLSIGRPWEIMRLPGLVSTQTVDAYTKGGNIGNYTTQYGIIPDLRVAYVINSLTNDSAGAKASVFADAVTSSILQPLYAIAKQQATSKYTGVYRDTTPGVNSTISITTDDSIGLVVDSWISNGTNTGKLLSVVGGFDATIRLYPADLEQSTQYPFQTVNTKGTNTTVTTTSNGTAIEAFRASFFNTATECKVWNTVDVARYATFGLDQFVFEIGSSANGTSQAQTLTLPAFRASYQRV